ncbi:MAG: dTDP-4-dehydrorhamnose 3,5-epimerase family protein [Candidatus Diapherotrites archaeon]|uniref:dTDP-4-dehydrorhamnose 3,5-epimerase family protein n=1 Tax=Candidatus Iainarchaeum sp. TaxID=3101447 RepID=A0A938YRB4_9ARCH|nr:dTDP-4-dehydrorhamnose 3,5-epimerase family protein [Candidatus Diapherotrites archaeon]
MEQKLIEGVAVKELKQIRDGRGRLFEMLRGDWPLFERFGQAYITTCRPGYAKAWHCHRKQKDNLIVVRGRAKIGLWDGRKDSKTFGLTNEFVIDGEKPVLVKVPESVYHGFTALGNEEAMVVNIPTNLFNYKNPDELRKPFNSKEIGFDWGTEEGDTDERSE